MPTMPTLADWLPAMHEEAAPLIYGKPSSDLRDLRCSAWCGIEGHPRRVLVARSISALDGRESKYRCPVCGRGTRQPPPPP
jgi:hypothetical protein